MSARTLVVQFENIWKSEFIACVVGQMLHRATAWIFFSAVLKILACENISTNNIAKVYGIQLHFSI